MREWKRKVRNLCFLFAGDGMILKLERERKETRVQEVKRSAKG
ncbi:hypothetical protein BVRB_6g149480 [Beta vulgaris subsp. vulgaris]|nr:hypothetical protein BVRB_6g149480 [Beta vulgaris subsp. vulgaris]